LRCFFFLDDVAQLNRAKLLMLAAAGLSHEPFGQRLIPIGTVYDNFVVRGLDALNCVCYQNARKPPPRAAVRRP